MLDSFVLKMPRVNRIKTKTPLSFTHQYQELIIKSTFVLLCTRPFGDTGNEANISFVTPFVPLFVSRGFVYCQRETTAEN